MRQAIQSLVDKGLLVRKRGVGTQVIHSQIRRSVELTSLYDDLINAGQEPSTTVLRLEQIELDVEAATQLRLPAGTTAWSLERLRTLGEQPLALMHNLVPTAVLDLSASDLATSGLYRLFRARGIYMRVAQQRIGSRRADSVEAKLLGQRKGDPLLTMTRTAFDDGGRAVEFGSHVYRPDRYSFEMTLVDR